MPISNEFLAFLLVLFVGAKIVVVWLLWSAAWAVPKPYRMRWPWTLWLLLLPIISAVLAFFLLVPLAKSYRRYFSQEKWPGPGERGYGSVMAIVIFVWLSWMDRLFVHHLTFARRWLHLLGPLPLVPIFGRTGPAHLGHIFSGWTGVVALIGGALVFWLLAKSYRRYFSQEKWPGRGGCGYGTAIATGLLSWLNLMKLILNPDPALAKRWPHLPVLVHYAHVGSSWAAAGAGIGWLAMVIIMLDLSKRAQRIQQRANAPSSANQALAWLESNAGQPPTEASADDTSSGGRR